MQRRGARPCAPTPYGGQRQMPPPNLITAQAPKNPPPFAKGGLEGFYTYTYTSPSRNRGFDAETQRRRGTQRGVGAGVLWGMRRGVGRRRGNPLNPPFAKGGLFMACVLTVIPAPIPSFPPHTVIPAKAGIHTPPYRHAGNIPGFWIPTCAGMTVRAAADSIQPAAPHNF